MEKNFSTSSDVEYLPVPDKSENDKKLYRIIKLKNGIQALLIEDTSLLPEGSSTEESSSEDSDSDTEPKITNGYETSSSEETDSSTDTSNDEESEDSDDDSDDGDEKLAAFALMVDVGSFSDPPDINGLAHFLEHMMFMGSEKYTSENEYESLVNKCGGSDNAETECEETTFHFEAVQDSMDQILDVFSELFVSPLMKKCAMTRERKSVESEFRLALSDDETRRSQLLASLGNPSHPCSIFTWGNLETLEKNIDDDHLHARVHEFRRRHYSADRIYLCMQARMSLDDMENMIVKHFSKIPRVQFNPVDFSTFNHENAYKREFYENVLFVKSFSNTTKLELTWCLPPIIYEYKCKAHEIVSNVIENDGEGSLSEYLKKKLWSLDMTAGVEESGFDNNSIYCLFTICVYLTEEGLKNLNEVLKAVFGYLKMMDNIAPPKSYFDELKKIEKINFRYETEKSAYANVKKKVVNLKYFPPKDILTGPQLYFEYNEDEIKKFIQALNTFKFNIMITSMNNNHFKHIVFDKKERWFGTEYASIEMPKEWRRLWDEREVYPEFHYSPPNEFITQDFTIFYKENEPNLNLEYPVKLMDTNLCELWFRQDDKFLLPKCYMYFYFITPVSLKSAKQ